MDDKCTMENLLLTTKGACDLYLHGTIESPTSNVHQAFSSALSDTLAMQYTIYKQMQQRGCYTTEQAQQQKLDQIKQKYTTATN